MGNLRQFPRDYLIQLLFLQSKLRQLWMLWIKIQHLHASKFIIFTSLIFMSVDIAMTEAGSSPIWDGDEVYNIFSRYIYIYIYI